MTRLVLLSLLSRARRVEYLRTRKDSPYEGWTLCKGSESGCQSLVRGRSTGIDVHVNCLRV